MGVTLLLLLQLRRKRKRRKKNQNLDLMMTWVLVSSTNCSNNNNNNLCTDGETVHTDKIEKKPNKKKRRKTFDEGKRNKISEENRNRMDSLILQSSFPWIRRNRWFLIHPHR